MVSFNLITLSSRVHMAQSNFWDYFFSFKFIKSIPLSTPVWWPAEKWIYRVASNLVINNNYTEATGFRRKQKKIIQKNIQNYWEFCTYTGFLSCLSLLFSGCSLQTNHVPYRPSLHICRRKTSGIFWIELSSP